jgi:hypothetical protein
MTQKMDTNQMKFLPWPFLALGILGVIMFILVLPLILGAFAVIGIFSGYLIWRVNKFFRRIEADHMWKDDSERQEFADRPIIDVSPAIVVNNEKS